MNIRSAKEEIKNTLRAYHQKDETGAYVYPVIRQRPILLMGPPGIGKTAIMEQIAKECGVGLVAYTITHHTRQSAIGLPRIVEKEYGTFRTSVTEYTLSEIIASVYECMERTGKREGILFIDEINCVSETLAPTMLQFLQNKTFGSHHVPEGWMIVAAGNPPEYNKSVREFDIVTLDRVREIDLEADLDNWMEYAWNRQIHGAILSYLNIKKDDFYLVRQNGERRSFVTARGWEDLSQLLKSYEQLDVEVTEALTVQFLQERRVAREFAAYYRLYCRYGTDYGIGEILEGTITRAEYAQKTEMAKNAGFEERFTVIGLLLAALGNRFDAYGKLDRRVVLLHETLGSLKRFLENREEISSFSEFLEEYRERIGIQKKMELLTKEQEETAEAVLRELENYRQILQEEHIRESREGFQRIRGLFEALVEQRRILAKNVRAQIDRAFQFAADSFGPEQEMILLVSGLTKNGQAMGFLAAWGSEGYLNYSRALLCQDVNELQRQCRELT